MADLDRDEQVIERLDRIIELLEELTARPKVRLLNEAEAQDRSGVEHGGEFWQEPHGPSTKVPPGS